MLACKTDRDTHTHTHTHTHTPLGLADLLRHKNTHTHTYTHFVSSYLLDMCPSLAFTLHLSLSIPFLWIYVFIDRVCLYIYVYIYTSLWFSCLGVQMSSLISPCFLLISYNPVFAVYLGTSETPTLIFCCCHISSEIGHGRP